MNIFKKIAGLDRTARNSEETALYEEAEDEVTTDEELEEELEQEEEASTKTTEDDWLPEQYEEGQLSIDVYQTPEFLVVKSTIAGVKSEEIDISINNDMLTIRGRREMDETVKDQDYLYRECYWGSFSRSIILPIEIKADKIEAFLENGVLTVLLPKAKTSKHISIKVRER